MMKQYLWTLIFVFLMTIGSSIDSKARRRVSKLLVHADLKLELNQVLKASNDLHTACVNQKEEDIKASTKILITRLQNASQKSSLAKEQRTHLLKILESAKSHLEMTQMAEGKQRRQSLQGAFSKIVDISRMYKLDKYRIFFCPKDKSVWIQKTRKAKNPVHPNKHLNCGKLVR